METNDLTNVFKIYVVRSIKEEISKIIDEEDASNGLRTG